MARRWRLPCWPWLRRPPALLLLVPPLLLVPTALHFGRVPASWAPPTLAEAELPAAAQVPAAVTVLLQKAVPSALNFSAVPMRAHQPPSFGLPGRPRPQAPTLPQKKKSPLEWNAGLFPSLEALQKVGQLAALSKLPAGHARGEAQAPAECTIFTLGDWPGRMPTFVELNLFTWKKHSHGLCKGPVLINDTNVKEYIPDMPKEYFSLPYVAAKSDMIRYAVLYHHGGIYMDSDFLVVKDLTDLITRLPKYDLISYETHGQSCKSKGSFSSNFVAGRKGSVVHKEIWEAQKRALTNHCDPSEMKLEKVCCLDDLTVKCHIPWAQLGEGVSHREVGRMLRRQADAVKVFCFRGEESFVPRDINLVFENKPKLIDAMAYWRARKEERPLDRIAYHLFNSNIGFKYMGMKELLDTNRVIGVLYNRSLSNTTDDGHPSSLQLLQEELPRSRLASRVDQALQTSLLPEDCGGLHRPEPSGASAATGAFRWCRELLRDGGGLEAIAFGVSAQDSWASELAGTFHIPVTLEECSSGEGAAQASIACSPAVGGAAERRALLARRLAARGPRSVVLRLELGGGEWELLGGLAEEELGKIAMLDLNAQLCAGGNASALEGRVQTLERLARLFEPAAEPAPRGAAWRQHAGMEVCGRASSKWQDPASISLGVSYVNRQSLIQVRAAAGAELVDRIDRATRPTVSQEECQGLDREASNGDGALYAWCRSVLDRALDKRASESLVGLSYGVSTWDTWSRRLSDAYDVPTVLLDCFATASNSGKTPSLEGYKKPHVRKDVCLAGAAKKDSEGRHFEALADRLAARGPRGTLLKIDVEGWEWEALQAAPDAELQKVDLLDMQFYPCNFLPSGGKRKSELQRRVALLERLARLFAATERAPADDKRFRARKDSDLCAGREQETFSVSYASRARLAELGRG